MLWNKARRSDNVEDARDGRQTRTLSGHKLGLGLGAIALAGIGLYAGVFAQRSTNRTLSPETFSHGTSAQRTQWFQTGFAEGRISQCDTFAADL